MGADGITWGGGCMSQTYVLSGFVKEIKITEKNVNNKNYLKKCIFLS
jgi:hypothetical protein